MTKPLDDSEFAVELHELLVAAALGDATDAQIARLNDLLMRDSGLRHQAARFFEEEAVLRREFNVIDRVGEFHKPLAKDLAGGDASSSEANVTCETAIVTGPRQRLFLAVAILIGASLGIIWWQRGAETAAFNQSADSRHERTLRNADAANAENSSSPRDLPPLAATILTPVTHVSWSGPQFASDVNSGPPTAIMREGVTSFISAFGRPAEGYMVCLRPDALLDLVVAGDAEGENALAVIEFDANGRPTGRRISFSNSAGDNAPISGASGQLLPATKKGRLGIWTERNDTAAARYYLFTGVHKLLNRSSGDTWHVSRLTAFVEEPGLRHIGWDDSGMPFVGDKDLVQFPDYDFDDVTATIRIRESGTDSGRRPAGLHVYSKTVARTDEPLRASSGEADRYQFSVAPGHAAIVKVCSRSGAPVEVAVFEKESNQLQWSCKKGKSPSPTLGICAIENTSSQPREFYLVGQKNEPAVDSQTKSLALAHSVLLEQEEFVTVGFRDEKLKTDFDKVRVDILTIGEI